jgi:type IV pilus assembly protein PilM
MLGLDVSSSSIKLVELGKNKAGELVLERCALEVLGPGWITDGNIDKFDEVAEAMRRLLKKSGTQARDVAMALPASSVLTKKIVLPGGLTDQELEVQVEAEANQYIPYPLDEASLDFCVLGPSAASAGDVDVLIAASRREKVQDIQGLAEAAGLRPVIVEVASNAARLAVGRLLRHLPAQGQGAVVALFDIGALTTSMQILCDDQLLYERDQAFGGSQLTQLIVSQYGFSPEEAESKKRSGELPEDYESTVLYAFVDTLVQEFGRALQFFFSSTSHGKIDHIFLAGGSAALPGLPEAVTQQLSWPCSLADPFDGLVIGEGVRQKKMVREAPSYLTACGLALRRFLP